ncbi:ubiquitin-conjugating enzyme E2 28 [Gossypium australe]|uniref:Ubiquitin-conjugating enzyme E2 28 n=1 Tax=Gossypium australe TaxID=47621 RepID=A0A5B6UPV0_9ROSI|nr:ubiquitin-conjugating enzyme E2 28 [Gossypium australe]
MASKQTLASKRIPKEVKELQKEHPHVFSLAPEDKEDIFSRRVTMRGPCRSPYEGGKFELIIHFPPDYPFRPPKMLHNVDVTFRNKIFHPNINWRYGSVSIDILKSKWNAALNISKVLLPIYSMLKEPTLIDPLDQNIANMYKTDRRLYETVARDWTQKYAMDPAYETILKELEGLEKSPPRYASAGRVAGDMFHWQAAILDLEGSPYAGGAFEVDIQFPFQYPVEPPKVVFRTKIFHPNINSNGSIGLDILKDGWSANLTISQVLLSICELLKNPKPDAPLERSIAHMYKTNRSEYDKTARRWTQEYAKG